MKINKLIQTTVVSAFAFAIAFGTGTGSAYADPAGNNGTVKVDGTAFDDHPNNEPHVGCIFEIDFYGFDEGEYNANVVFTAVSPTPPGNNNVTLVDDSFVFIGEDSNAGGGSTDGLDAEKEYDLSSSLAGIEPQPQQGHHVRLDITAPFSQGNETKSKEFWVEGCSETEVPDEDNGGDDNTGGDEDTDEDTNTDNGIGGTSDSQSGKTSSMGKNGPDCDSDQMEVTYDVKENGEGKEGIEVTFSYKGEEKKATTNSDGRARVNYAYKGGEDSVLAKANDGYPDQAVYVEKYNYDNCEVSDGIGGAITPNNGQVLGATTVLGATGSVTDAILMALRTALGFISGAVAYFYSKKAQIKA